MKKSEDIKGLIDLFQSGEQSTIQYDEKAILDEYQKGEGNQSIAVKVLSILGGILASLAFLGFLYITGLYDNVIATGFVGFFIIAISILINRESYTIIIDTISISLYLIGLFLIGISCATLFQSEDFISMVCIGISLITLILVQNYILSFINILIINGSIVALMLNNKLPNLIHVYISILAVILTYIFLNESKLLKFNKSISKLYNPLRTSLMVTFIALIVVLKIDSMTIPSEHIWISSVIIIGSIIYLIGHLQTTMNFSKKTSKWWIYIIVAFTLTPTAIAPGIAGAILLLLLSFLVNYKTGLVVTILSFIYFISEFYYDLQFTLLTKAILLFLTGVLFLGLFWFTSKKLINEKI